MANYCRAVTKSLSGTDNLLTKYYKTLGEIRIEKVPCPRTKQWFFFQFTATWSSRTSFVKQVGFLQLAFIHSYYTARMYSPRMLLCYCQYTVVFIVFVVWYELFSSMTEICIYWMRKFLFPICICTYSTTVGRARVCCYFDSLIFLTSRQNSKDTADRDKQGNNKNMFIMLYFQKQ